MTRNPVRLPGRLLNDFLSPFTRASSPFARLSGSRSVAARLIALGLLLAVAPAAFPQNYPMPGHTSQDPVICTTCPNYPNAPTWPYGSPLTSFIGRYVDSQLTRDYQAGFGMRTLRAGRVEVVPEHDRVYMIIGSTFASYKLSTFFTEKLGQALSPNDYIEGTWREGNPAETHLRWDGHTYPEGPNSGWQTAIVDMQHFLYGFDTDDRNLVYLAYSAFGWGIVRNESDASLTFVSQVFQNPGVSPTSILSIELDSNYYAVISDGGTSSLVYDVTDPVSPSLVRTLPFGVSSWDKTADHVALITGGKVRIYTNSALISGEAALQEYTATAGSFLMVTSDGAANFFAVENHSNSPLRFSVFTPSGGSFEGQSDRTTSSSWPWVSVTAPAISPYGAMTRPSRATYACFNSTIWFPPRLA